MIALFTFLKRNDPDADESVRHEAQLQAVPSSFFFSPRSHSMQREEWIKQFADVVGAPWLDAG